MRYEKYKEEGTETKFLAQHFAEVQYPISAFHIELVEWVLARACLSFHTNRKIEIDHQHLQPYLLTNLPLACQTIL